MLQITNTVYGIFELVGYQKNEPNLILRSWHFVDIYVHSNPTTHTIQMFTRVQLIDLHLYDVTQMYQ